MNLIIDTISQIRLLDGAWLERAAARQLELTKPPHSLGRLEIIANRLCAIQETPRPQIARREIFVFAASHGVCAENISPYPAEITAQMVLNFLDGGAAINALARAANADLKIVDIGVDADFAVDAPNFVAAKVARGTRNFVREAAMSAAEMRAAIEIGINLARRSSAQIIGLGEMGIGNTTAASAVTAALLGLTPAQTTGRGTGADDAMLRHKIAVVECALALHKPNQNDAFEILQTVGGLEIAGLVGLCLGAAARRIAVVTDGFIATSAAALAVKMCPAVKDYLFASHNSVEIGHAALLEFIAQKPFFDLEMRLGEGTGAALALNLIAAACAAFNEMNTFSGAQLSQKLATDEHR